MNQTVEVTKVDYVTEEQRRIAHNARNSENYKKLINMDVAALKKEETAEKKYPSLDAYKPLHTRREITFEDVLIPETVQKERVDVLRNARSIDYKNSIYNDAAYRAAALNMARAREKSEAAVEEEKLSMPTSTTLQYVKTAQASVDAAVKAANALQAEEERVVFARPNDERAYYMALAKKVAVIFAVIVVALVSVVAINSAILNGMNLEIISLQETLSGLQEQVIALQQAIEAEISWESILEFIQANGMILAS